MTDDFRSNSPPARLLVQLLDPEHLLMSEAPAVFRWQLAQSGITVPNPIDYDRLYGQMLFRNTRAWFVVWFITFFDRALRKPSHSKLSLLYSLM